MLDKIEVMEKQIENLIFEIKYLKRTLDEQAQINFLGHTLNSLEDMEFELSELLREKFVEGYEQGLADAESH
jgi:hypothetical protein